LGAQYQSFSKGNKLIIDEALCRAYCRDDRSLDEFRASKGSDSTFCEAYTMSGEEPQIKGDNLVYYYDISGEDKAKHGVKRYPLDGPCVNEDDCI
jgi:hypothetical protein